MTESNDLVSKCLEALVIARKTALALGEKGRTPVPTKKDEPVTKSDLEISRVLRNYFLKSGLNAQYISEEAGQINEVKNPKFNVFWDEVDGTFNWQRGALLPSSIVISAFNYKDSLKFKDAVFAGVLNLSSGDLWHAEKGKGCYFKENKVKSFGKTELGKNTFLVIDHGPCPGPDSNARMERFLDIYKSTWPHNISSAGIHLAGVASGHFDAAILPIQKAHELGAGYLLVNEAGRYISDFKGDSLDDQIFNFNKAYEIVAADTREMGEKLLKRIIY